MLLSLADDTDSPMSNDPLMTSCDTVTLLEKPHITSHPNAFIINLITRDSCLHNPEAKLQGQILEEKAYTWKELRDFTTIRKYVLTNEF